MNWETVKKYLKDRNRIDMICNKGSENETIITWNGNIICKYDGPKRFRKAIIYSAKPIPIHRIVLVEKAKSIYEFNKHKNVLCGYKLPPIKGEPKPIIKYL